MDPTIMWILIGVGGGVVLVALAFFVRFLARRASEARILQLFESGQYDLAVDRLASKGRLAEAATQLVRWGQIDRAAKTYVELDEWSKAAELYEKEHQFGTAAVYHLKAGNNSWAARCYARHGRMDKAAELYREMGDVDTAIHILVDAGDFETAAAIQREAGGVDAAVELLLEADRHEDAAAMLREHGQENKADRLLAEHYDDHGEWSRAAERYEALDQTSDALDRHRRAGNHARAGELLQREGNFKEAGAEFKKAKAFEKAAACYEKSDDRREAARQYLLAGMMKQAVDNLLLARDVVSVAQIYSQSGFAKQALEVLKVPHTHAQYQAAHVLRARFLERQGDVDGARNELIGVVTRLGLSRQTLGVVFMIAELYTQQGDGQNALRLLERLESRGLRHEDLDRRLAKLRDAVEKTKVASAGGNEDTQISVAAGLPESERYEFQKKLGQGGMGAVYAARDRRLNRRVAIKLLLESDLPSDMARKYFFREAETVAALSHPNIVGIYDYGEIDGRPFIAMEFIEGYDLEQLVRNGGVLDVGKMVPICGQLASALDYAHQRSIMHRDIKLGNVMVTVDDLVKLMDFGLAKAISENPDRSLLVIGTPYYMAPEQIAHEDIDHRVDVYALGILMFRLVTGRLPFETGDVLRSQRYDPPPNPAMYDPKLPKPLVGLILQCLEKRREDRPQICGEIAERLLVGVT